MKKILLLTILFYTYALNTSAQSSDTFTFELLKNLEKDKKSTFVSPYSIRTILSLCAEGASGNTLAEMVQTLSLAKDAEQNRIEMQRIGKLSESQNFQLLTTNTIWADKKLLVFAKFAEIAKKYYFSIIQMLSFSDNPKKATKTINDFVAEKTKQMIKNLLPDGVITSETKMVLTNTIYFKADWEKSFDKANTQYQDFWLNRSEKKSVKMMYQKRNFSAGIYQNHKIVALPYKGGEIRMWVLLPENNDLPKLLSKIDTKMWAAIKATAQEQEVLLTLPLFEFETKYKLSKNLKDMGIRTAFGDNAEFPYISNNVSGLKISEVIHQAKIKVEEKGTEAAAATAVIMHPKSSAMNDKMPSLPFIFKADSPFLFIIEHKNTGEILFAGTVLDPTTK